MFIVFYSVKSSYPEESGYVDKRKKELDKLWKDLKVGNHFTLTSYNTLSTLIMLIVNVEFPPLMFFLIFGFCLKTCFLFT